MLSAACIHNMNFIYNIHTVVATVDDLSAVNRFAMSDYGIYERR